MAARWAPNQALECLPAAVLPAEELQALLADVRQVEGVAAEALAVAVQKKCPERFAVRHAGCIMSSCGGAASTSGPRTRVGYWVW